ncbi:MAG: glycosyltransferase [Candidatus Undinarchaeales archaeon]
MKSKKVKAVLGPYPPRYGGAEKRAVQEFEKSKGIFIGTSHKPELNENEKVILIKKRRFPIDCPLLLIKIFKNRKKIKKISAHFATTFGFTAFMAKKLFNIPYTATCHGTDIFQNLDSSLHRWFTLKALRNADEIFAVSKKLKERISEEGIKKSKVKLSVAKVDKKRFKKRKVKKKNQIIFVGKVQKVKGVDLLIEAFSKIEDDFPKYKLIIVGDFDEPEYYEKLKKRIDDLKLNKKIEFLGNRDDVEKLLNQSKLFVLPSRKEGYGIALAEALSCKLKCVATNIGGIPEVLEKYKGNCLLVEPEAEKIAEAMKKQLKK